MATMATTYSLLTLILCLLTGGGNDLLDYLPSEAYWAQKQLTVSVETMVAQLSRPDEKDVAALVAQLGSPDAETRDRATVSIREAGPGALKQVEAAVDSPDAEVRRRARTLARQLGGDEVEQGVRRLMAIRTLGELGKPEGVAALKPLLTSKELFVAEYAQAAIDAIEGKRPDAGTARAVAPSVLDDVWMLPAACRAVGQLAPRRGSPIGFAELMAAAQGNDDARNDETAAEVTQVILSLAEQFGNVRIDSITFGLAGNPLAPGTGEEKPFGSVTLILRGRYNSEWARTLARSERVPVRDVDGVEVFEPDGEQAWLMPSDELFVFVASPAPDGLPLNEVVAAVKSGKGALAEVADVQKLVASADTKQILWGAALVMKEQRELPAVGAFDRVMLAGTREEKKTLRLTIKAEGGDAAEATTAAELVARHAKESADFLQGMQVAPIVTLAMQLLQSVKTEADGTSATITASLETTPAAILSLPMLSDAKPAPRRETPGARPGLRRAPEQAPANKQK